MLNEQQSHRIKIQIQTKLNLYRIFHCIIAGNEEEEEEQQKYKEQAEERWKHMNLLDLLVSLQVLNFVRMEFSWFRFHFSFRFFPSLVFPRCQRCFGVSITTFSFTTSSFSHSKATRT